MSDIIHNLKAFKKFPCKLMVQSYSKDYVEDSSALYMPQLVLWNRLNLQIQAAEKQMYKLKKQTNKKQTVSKWKVYRKMYCDYSKSHLQYMKHSLSMFLLLFLASVLLLKITYDSIQDLFLTTLTDKEQDRHLDD